MASANNMCMAGFSASNCLVSCKKFNKKKLTFECHAHHLNIVEIIKRFIVKLLMSHPIVY